MAETVVSTGARLYPANNGASGEALARDHEIYFRDGLKQADFVAAGGDLATSAASLEVTLDAFTGYIDGRQSFREDIGPASYAITLPPNETRYIMFDRAGRLFHRDTDNPVAGTDHVMHQVTTDATGVTNHVVRMRRNQFAEVGVDDDESIYLSSDRTKAFHYDSASGRVILSANLQVLRMLGLPNPSVNDEAATKGYVDTEIGAISQDHGGQTGLLDDDHPQYLRTDGTRALTGAMSMGGNRLTTLGAPTASGDAARKADVDSVGTASSAHIANQSAGVHGSTVAPTASKLVHRDAAGRSQFADPAAAQDASTKAYTDAQRDTRLALTGGTLTGLLTTRGIQPSAPDTYNIGSPSAYYTVSYVRENHVGDQIHHDPVCLRCDKAFQKGEFAVMDILDIEKATEEGEKDGVRTVPAHLHCAFAAA